MWISLILVESDIYGEKRMSLENIRPMKFQEFFFFRKNFNPLCALSPKHEMNELQE